MYFPSDPYPPDLEQRIVQAVTQCQIVHPKAHVYTLVDACLDKEWAQQIWHVAQSRPHQIQALYRDTPLADLQECSPFLCTLARDELPALLSRSRSLPMLSFIQSSLDLNALRLHLARFVRARTTDGLWFPVRWGFPLGVPALIEALDPAPRALLFSGFHAWHLITRTGTLETVEGQDDGTPLSDPVPGMLAHGFALDDKAFSRLVDASEADALLIAEAERTPALVAGRRPSMLYDMAQRVLKEMHRQQIREPSRRRQLLCDALECDSAEAALAHIAAHAAHS